MSLYKVIEDTEINVVLVPIQCNCGIQMKIDKRIIEKDETFQCPNCRKIGFAD